MFDIGTDYDVPADGVVAYKYFTVPTNFTEDKWVESAEVRPDQRAVVHHIIAFVKEPGNTSSRPTDTAGILVGYAPGENPLKLMPGTAVLVKAGSSLFFQVHYTPTGKAVKDRSYIGLRFAKEAAETTRDPRACDQSGAPHPAQRPELRGAGQLHGPAGPRARQPDAAYAPPR